MKRQNKWRRLLWVLLLGYTMAHLGYSVTRYSIFRHTSSGDFNRAYQEAKGWQVIFSAPVKTGNFHPPFYYAILLTMDSLLGGLQNVQYFSYFLQFLIFPLAIIFLVRAVWIGQERPSLVAYGIATVLSVNFQPLLETLAQHKVEGVEFFLICLAIFFLRRKWDLLCGGILMLAAHLKYLPAFLLAHLFVQREWKVLLGSLVGMAVVFAVLFSSFGPRVLSSGLFGHAVGLLAGHEHEGNRPEASVEMQTLSGTVNRWFARPVPPTSFMEYIDRESYMPVPNPALALGVAQALKILALAGWLFFIQRKRGRTERERTWSLNLLEISLTLVMILVISQASRVHYSILVLPGFLMVGLLLTQHHRLFPMREKCLFGLAYALTGMLIPGGLLDHLPPHPVWRQEYSSMYLWYSLPFYGLMLLVLCILLCHRRLSRAGATYPPRRGSLVP